MYSFKHVRGGDRNNVVGGKVSLLWRKKVHSLCMGGERQQERDLFIIFGGALVYYSTPRAHHPNYTYKFTRPLLPPRAHLCWLCSRATEKRGSPARPWNIYPASGINILLSLCVNLLAASYQDASARATSQNIHHTNYMRDSFATAREQVKTPKKTIQN